jgi:hypothetical protein
MTAARLARAVAKLAFAAASLLVIGCTLDLSQKHDCRNDGDCIGGRICVVGRCQPPTATDGGNESPNYVFVTSATVSTVFQSLDDADQVCAGAATMAGLPGHFHAWLSTSAAHARDRLQGARGWIRPDGAPFADGVEDVVAGRIFNPASLDENGAPTSGPVVTGTAVDGRGDATLDCGDWSATATGTAIAGTTQGTTGVWTYFTTVPCGSSAHLYCFGVDRVAAVAPPTPHGKLAFLSDGPFAVGGGLGAADAQCQSEADAADLPGMFSGATVGRANYMPWWFATGDVQPCSSNAVEVYCFQSD